MVLKKIIDTCYMHDFEKNIKNQVSYKNHKKFCSPKWLIGAEFIEHVKNILIVQYQIDLTEKS